MFHLCRTFEDPDITHVEGEVDPVRDLDIINEELRLKVSQRNSYRIMNRRKDKLICLILSLQQVYKRIAQMEIEKSSPHYLIYSP